MHAHQVVLAPIVSEKSYHGSVYGKYTFKVHPDAHRTQIRQAVEGKGLLVRPAYDETVEEFIRPLFQQYYTMSFDNYPVELERLEHADIRPCRQPS